MSGLVRLLMLTSVSWGSPPSPSTIHSYMSQQEIHYYFGTDAPSDYDVIHVDTSHQSVSKRSGEIAHKVVKFTAMGDEYTLKLRPNKNLLAPFAVVGKRNGPNNSTKSALNETVATADGNGGIWLDYGDDDYMDIGGHLEDHKDRDMSMDELMMDRKAREQENCHYLHDGDGLVAAMSLCDGEAHGLVLAPTHSLEVIPLNHRLKRMLSMWNDDNSTSSNNTNSREAKQMNFGKNLHLVKRSDGPPRLPTEDDSAVDVVVNSTKTHETRPFLDEVRELFADQDNTGDDEYDLDRKSKRSGSEQVIETALFVDSAAYRRFSRYFTSIGESDPDNSVRRLALGFMNGIQAIYMLPSLRHNVRFTVVRLELWQSDPSEFYHYQGDREPLLDSFCNYQSKLNAADDSNPGFWDLGLYVSGLNFFAIDSRGRKNGVTMGLARVGGTCHREHACVVGELGVTTDTGKPYPSAGFTSVFVMAHEIGHNLGMNHDHKEGCDRNGYIMSESRGTKGESQWSSCSVNALSRYINDGSLSCLKDDNARKAAELGMADNILPGEVWSANAQCQIFLLDSDAHIDHRDSDFQDMCYAIKCRTPKREGYYRAGPALEGTACGEGKWCRHGSCVVNDKPKQEEAMAPGTWSDWRHSSCQSGCLENGVGYRTKKRTCQRGRLVHTLAGCRGPTTGMDFCNDDSICQTRQDTDKYATEQCKIFSSYVPGIDAKSQGVQVQYSSKRLWQSCAIYCKRSDTGQWYTPRLELNDLPISPYFPDGTLCHKDGGTEYYCQKNSCLEKDSRVAKQDTADLNLLFNAPPQGDLEVPKALSKYYTLDENQNPVDGGAFAGIKDTDDIDDDWEVKDYID